jgi:PEP-CTERM motif-containing protein
MHVSPTKPTKMRKEVTMKSSIKILFAIGCAYAIATASSSAQLYTFDENGNSSGPSSAPPISPGALQPDPSGGLAVPVLVYNLALPVITGDVVLLEPGNPATGGQYSDVVRFWNPTGANATQIIFYSDVSATDPANDLADTGLPQLINPVFINEVGPEGNNGALYTPAPGGPGSVAGAVGLQYNIISDVPEPSALALAALAGGLLLFTLKRRTQIKV